jgi:hypothetical protein
MTFQSEISVSSVLVGVCLGLVPGLTGCSRAGLEIDETDVVLTFEDEDRDYSRLTTFSMPDKVVDLCEAASEGSVSLGGRSGFGGGDLDPNCKKADHSLDRTILSELRRQMEAMGYREVEDPTAETPDVAFFVGIVARDNWYLSTSPGYCYDYYYWWYGGCWYPGYSYSYNLPTSTILIDMGAINEANGKVVGAWTAILSGLHKASGNKSGNERVQDAMKRAFEQSPYLAKGGE